MFCSCPQLDKVFWKQVGGRERRNDPTSKNLVGCFHIKLLEKKFHAVCLLELEKKKISLR